MIEVGIVNKSSYDLPQYAKLGDSGMDVRANISEPITLKPFERRLFPTGIYVEIPEGYEIQVRSRSGLALKKGLIVLNAPGTIDSGYRNEIGVILWNASMEEQEINPGDRIAQLVLAKVEKINWNLKDSVDTNTDRGLGGYGSSGVQ